MGLISDTYGVEQTSPTHTDAYHFTTAYAYWREGRQDNPAVSYMFGRKEALNGGYTVAGGLEGVIDIVKRWKEHSLTEKDVAFIRAQKCDVEENRRQVHRNHYVARQLGRHGGLPPRRQRLECPHEVGS